MNRLADTDGEGCFLAEFAFQCRVSSFTVLDTATGDGPRTFVIRADQKDVVVLAEYDRFLRHMPAKVRLL